MLNLKQTVVDILKPHLTDMNESDILDMLEYPPNPDMGDVALPCFKLSRIFRKAPPMIAEELAKQVEETEFFEAPKNVSGYLNFYVKRNAFIKNVVGAMVDGGENYGSTTVENPKNVVIDYSSPNIAKPFHIGHLRSTMIGNALYRILEFNGYNCIGINHLGDWGTQFGKLIVAIKNWGSEDAINEKGIAEMMRLYVLFHDEAEKDPSLNDEARGWLVKMEQGDEEALRLWKWTVDISLKEYDVLYKRLDVDFDYFTGESFYNDKMQAVIDELREKNLMVESDGAQVVDLEDYNMPPSLILRSDGGTLYTTRDISAAMYRMKEYNFHKALYVTGVTQALHFKQWFKVVELMGYDWANDLHHIPFGTVSLQGSKLSTRKGQILLLTDVLDESVAKTKEIIEEKNPNLPNKELVAEQMGVGAIVFSDLSNSRIKDVTFSWEEILNFDGETGPYVQYTHARACSVLRKSELDPSTLTFDESVITSDAEFELVKCLYSFPEQLALAGAEFEPSILTRYLVDVAQAFNRFYNKCPILVDDETLKQSRLVLVKSVQQILRKGLWLIGVAAPEQV